MLSFNYVKLTIMSGLFIAGLMPATAQGAPGDVRVMPMDIDTATLSRITSDRLVYARTAASTRNGQIAPGHLGAWGPKTLGSNQTQPTALQAMSAAKIARLRAFAGPQGNEDRRPREACNSDVNIGSIVADGTPRIQGSVRQEVYTGDVTVINLNRCRDLGSQGTQLTEDAG